MPKTTATAMAAMMAISVVVKLKAGGSVGSGSIGVGSVGSGSLQVT